MPQPPRYAPAYDFTQDAGNQTNHTALNQELAALRQTLDATLNNLALIQNDQGGASVAFAQSVMRSTFVLGVYNRNGQIVNVQLSAI